MIPVASTGMLTELPEIPVTVPMVNVAWENPEKLKPVNMIRLIMILKIAFIKTT